MIVLTSKYTTVELHVDVNSGNNPDAEGWLRVRISVRQPGRSFECVDPFLQKEEWDRLLRFLKQVDNINVTSGVDFIEPWFGITYVPTQDIIIVSLYDHLKPDWCQDTIFTAAFSQNGIKVT